MSKDQPLIPPFGKQVSLKDYDPDDTGEYKDKDEVQKIVEDDLQQMGELQELLYAEAQRSLLIVCQAMDTAGKDGTVQHVFSGLNPQGIHAASFKAPTPEEAAHDFLWRIHPHTPGKGRMSIFNRSHYEDVLAVRVHKLVPKATWKARFAQINDFEETLSANGTVILKFFLHISKAEQKKRLEERLHDPKKQWKFDPNDLKEREYWDNYMEAYEDVLTRCNTKTAPWYIVPANHKWYRNLVIGRAVARALEAMKLEYPKPIENLHKVVIPD